MNRLDNDDSAGHYRTAGASLIAFGGGCGLFAALLTVFGVGDLGFIGPPAALILCAIVVAVGAVMLFGSIGD
jgi:hypothetical protein